MNFIAFFCFGAKRGKASEVHEAAAELTVTPREDCQWDLKKLSEHKDDTMVLVQVHDRDSAAGNIGLTPKEIKLSIEREGYDPETASLRWSWMAMNIKSMEYQDPNKSNVKIELLPGKGTSSCLPQINIR